ncbi:MAG: GDP-mannose 4,6-dehydratase [Hymenobacteraceae bacterium]|nr:GDP-mannose 4,6-dehydratase [Hymenobacteraceae bacterium]
MSVILVTGAAGFIGSHLTRTLLAADATTRVIGFDNFDPFYPRAIKEQNLADLRLNPRFAFVEGDITDLAGLQTAMAAHAGISTIVHLAARAGVRPSIIDPAGYQHANYIGTLNLLELAKARGIKQFVFASSSSVYGVNPNVPWSEADRVLQPISPYAASKVAGELLGHTYSHLYGMRFIGLRFFTVYAPGQRPDLAIHKFARLLMAGQPIPQFGDGSTRRDYTYIDDIVAGIQAAIHYNKSSYEIINLGNHQTITLRELIEAMEDAFEVRAQIELHPEQPGDVPITYAAVEKAHALLGYAPQVSIREGLRRFAQWYHQTYAPVATPAANA